MVRLRKHFSALKKSSRRHFNQQQDRQLPFFIPIPAFHIQSNPKFWFTNSMFKVPKSTVLQIYRADRTNPQHRKLKDPEQA
jgi:hypothetical protein